MSERPSLHHVVRLKGRFHRSVQLVQDYSDRQLRESYLVTPTVKKIARRMLGGLADPQGARAWSLAGPFGTGKSSFVLYLLDVLTGARSAPDAVPGQLELAPPRLLPILLVGERTPLCPALLLALAEALGPWEPAFSLECRRRAEDPALNGQTTLEAFSQALALFGGPSRDRSRVPEPPSPKFQADGVSLSAAPAPLGLVVVVDELGKFLEFAAHHPEKEDLFILQGLAELAARSPRRMILMTVLHSALTDYLKGRDDVRMVEWLKVQGRFVDQSFIESHEQLLTLIGQAIQPDFPPALSKAYHATLAECLGSPVLKEASARYALAELLPTLLPLHPLTALLLPGLFKSKLAQNERSLFSFLTSHEPEGFLDFLEHTPVDADPVPLYRLDRLYDYIRSALGAATYRGEHARRWAEVEQALERAGRAVSPLAQKVIKTVGLVSIHGASAGLRASRALLALSLGDSPALDTAIETLERQSILVYRRHEGGYGLWEGSDVDLEAAYKRSVEQVEREAPTQRLGEHLELRPWVARAHSFLTGSLRAFETRVLSGEHDGLHPLFHSQKLELDGSISFVLVRDAKQAERVALEATRLTRAAEGPARLRIVAIPKPLKGLSDAVLALEAWRHVEQNTPELKGDPVARREVQARIQHAQEVLDGVAGETFGLRGQPFRPELCTWIHGGKQHGLSSSHAFMQWLSDVCGEVYAETPSLHNELINRTVLSSAAVAARNLLLKAMLKHPQQYRLGIAGTPPEVSMYESVLVQSGIHAMREGQYRFGPPEPSSKPGGWSPLWQALEAFLVTTRHGRRPVLELYALLKAPPFGMKEGPLPVILVALLLAQGAQLALYKGGMFVPELREEVLELLARNPKDFALQQLSFAPEERRLLEAIRSAIQQAGLGSAAGGLELAAVARDLIAPVARLNVYTRNTRRISPLAQKVRECVLTAREPLKLLLEDVPALFSSEAQLASAEEVRSALLAALTELLRAYPSLLDTIEEQLRGAFQLHGDQEEAREQLRQRFHPLLSFKSDATLSAFVREASSHSDGDWRERLARVIHRGQPPSAWQDPDVVMFTHRLDILVSDLARLEELAAEKRRAPSTQVFRLGWLAGEAQEARAVVSILPELELEIQGLRERTRQVLDALKEPVPEKRRQIQLAALAMLAAELMQDAHD